MSTAKPTEHRVVFDFEHELSRIRTAAQGLVSVVDDVTQLVKKADILHIGGEVGVRLPCHNRLCGRDFFERRTVGSPTHGFCSEECYEVVTGNKILR